MTEHILVRSMAKRIRDPDATASFRNSPIVLAGSIPNSRIPSISAAPVRLLTSAGRRSLHIDSNMLIAAEEMTVASGKVTRLALNGRCDGR